MNNNKESINQSLQFVKILLQCYHTEREREEGLILASVLPFNH